MPLSDTANGKIRRAASVKHSAPDTENYDDNNYVYNDDDDDTSKLLAKPKNADSLFVNSVTNEMIISFAKSLKTVIFNSKLNILMILAPNAVKLRVMILIK